MKRYRRQLYFILLTAFLLGNYKGYIALWKENTHSPACVFPYPISSLPKADQSDLNRGIYISSENELSRILEDFLS